MVCGCMCIYACVWYVSILYMYECGMYVCIHACVCFVHDYLCVCMCHMYEHDMYVYTYVFYM